MSSPYKSFDTYVRSACHQDDGFSSLDKLRDLPADRPIIVDLDVTASFDNGSIGSLTNDAAVYQTVTRQDAMPLRVQLKKLCKALHATRGATKRKVIFVSKQALCVAFRFQLTVLLVECSGDAMEDDWELVKDCKSHAWIPRRNGLSPLWNEGHEVVLLLA